MKNYWLKSYFKSIMLLITWLYFWGFKVNLKKGMDNFFQAINWCEFLKCPKLHWLCLHCLKNLETNYLCYVSQSTWRSFSKVGLNEPAEVSIISIFVGFSDLCTTSYYLFWVRLCCIIKIAPTLKTWKSLWPVQLYFPFQPSVCKPRCKLFLDNWCSKQGSSSQRKKTKQNRRRSGIEEKEFQACMI